jgi:acyltransferase, WS/DGAT/MGAT
MAEQLSPLDAMFLELEQADESAHMHIGAVMVFQAPRGARPPTLKDVQAHLEARLGTLPRYRQRLSSPRTGGLTWPSWEAVEGFELADHVRRARLPAPGGDAELLEWASDFYSHRLDRTRPLWEAVLVEGMPRGRWALATKTHHCLVDGVGSVDVGYLMLDAHPSPRGTEPSAESLSPAPDSGEPHDDASPWLLAPGVLLRGARAGAGALRHPQRTLERSRAMVELLIRDELIAAPHTSLNEPIGGTRRLEAVRMPLAELKAIKNGLGGTINDVVLALCTGGLRRLLIARGEALPEHGLRGQIPVNIRDAQERLALGNRLSSLFVHLPVAEEDPRARYERTLEEAESLKHGDQAVGSRSLVELTSLAPPMLHTLLAQSLFDARLFNLTITNVPGSQSTLYAQDSRLVEVLPLVPLFARHAVGIAVVSYDGDVVFGLNADRDGVPDLEVLSAGITAELANLRGLVHERPTTPAGSAS